MKYQLNPIIVDAVKVVGVGERLSDGSIRVLLEEDGPKSHGTVVKPSEMAALPKVGDYFVTHEDGTRNLVPGAVFETTHTPVASDESENSEEKEVEHDPASDPQEASAGDEQTPEDAETEVNTEN